MDLRIADTFTDSLARLTGEEQKAVKTTAFDLQVNPANPGLSFHKLDDARDKNFWSVRASGDIRLIVHRSSASLLLCYVDHHDRAYSWAERRRLETHPQTGAAQLVEIRERVEEIAVPRYVEIVASAPVKPPLFAERPDAELLGYGVPTEWLADVRQATEDSLLELVGHLPGEAAEALLQLATGGQPQVSRPASAPGLDPFAHPDAQRRFRLMGDLEELERALEYPWDKWTVFLHPAQRQWVERDFAGPARVCGSAGTGKTIVALHRAVFLARKHPDSRILLTTFSETLANALRTKLRRLISNEPRLAERLEVQALDAIGERLYERHLGPPHLATRDLTTSLLAQASEAAASHKFSLGFLRTEWEELVDAWQLERWESYRDVKRLGRKTRLPEAQRAALWAIFESMRAGLRDAGLMTRAALFSQLASDLANRRQRPFDFVVVDEAQDVSVPQLRFLAALGADRPSGLFFAGDLGQRIFQPPFSWRSLGVDIRGRARTLHVNYRTSHQIRTQADRLLGPEVSDVDGNAEDRRGTVSAFNGPTPRVMAFDSPEGEIAAVGAWIAECVQAGVAPHEIGVFVRSAAELDRARQAVAGAGLPFKMLDEHVETSHGHLCVGTMHLAKGLEFRAVVVMACDDEIIPLQARIETVTDDSDLEEVYNTERHLLYVACTRARDHLLVSGVEPASEFLDDLQTPLPSVTARTL
ncbi:UvrD-helicase domain-containing protein [uncultured Thiodictyon sp.]|jgi:superfamily I DNA/RNA helicase/mRNA-degrading endonuclease RelE of RelBE toxin-antitoxin system|uniref:UvrD-helicase domain-containing protein n=1 Tax=uncultured Thiodictyon sp. TaxID=1846217 RepID=UPI0025D44120|nr:UvrD-helicase domain-containing protein [uncultured Thiodictyon sp.]